jgi:hypothetical protein
VIVKSSPRIAPNPGALAFDAAVVVVTLVVIVAVIASIFRPSIARLPFGPIVAAPPGNVQTSSSSIPRDDTLELVSGAKIQALATGSEFLIGKNLTGRLALAHPSDSPYVRELDLALAETAAPSRAVSDATVVATVHMASMDMGTIHEVAVPAADGHYKMTVPFAMPGEWQIDLQIMTPNDYETVTMHLFVWS